MAAAASTPRSRGCVSGLILIVLGTWGGIAPYAGPAFGYGFEPDRAWAFNQGRLVLSALPGAVTLVAGLVIALTRSRGLGGVLAVIAALGGAWFVVGEWALKLLPPSTSAFAISAGKPIGTTVRQVALTEIGCFWGVGALIVFFAGLALGRFSIIALKDGQQPDPFMTAAARGGYQPAESTASFSLTQPQHAGDLYAAYSVGQHSPQYTPESYPGQYPAQYAADQYPAQYPPEHDESADGPDLTTQNTI